MFPNAYVNHADVPTDHAGDTLGNIALLDIDGKEVWERHMASMIMQVCGGRTELLLLIQVQQCTLQLIINM